MCHKLVQVSVSRRVGLYWPTPLFSEGVFTTAPANSRDTTTSMSDNFIEMTSFTTKRGDPPSHQNQNSSSTGETRKLDTPRYKVGALCILFYDGIEIISRMCLPNKYISVTVSVKAFCLTTLTI